MIRRTLILYALFFVLMIIVGLVMGSAFTMRLAVEACAFAFIALGLNIQWGFGGLFNFGVMGFLMLGGFAVTAMSVPVHTAFWNSDGPWMLGKVLIAMAIGAALIVGAGQLHRLRFPRWLKRTLQVVAWIAAYIIFRTQLDPAVQYIERSSFRWVGGLGLPVWVGWIFGGVLAAGVGYIVGRICLGLRTDYLAIATIGIGEIMRAIFKNADWLTHGTLTVSPIPWPVPLPQDYQAWGATSAESFIYARAGYLVVLAVILVVALFLINRAYSRPWGRMMRAIRDNHVAAAAMGKNVGARQIQIFVFGSVLIGIGGGLLVSFNQLYDPGGYRPINHTFVVWVMVIVGGAGNSFGAVLGGLFIYVVWMLSEPASVWLFGHISDLSTSLGWGAIPDIEARSLQMRVFLLGLVVVLALRYAPRGLIPEYIPRHGKPEAPNLMDAKADPKKDPEQDRVGA